MRTGGFEGDSPRGKISYLKALDQKSILDLPLQRHVKPDGDLQHSAYWCTGCGACEDACPVDIPLAQRWLEMKGWLTEEVGLEPPGTLPLLYKNVLDTGNIYGEDPNLRDAWAKEFTFDPSPEVLFFAGCVTSYRKQTVAKNCVKLLQAAGARVGILGKRERCSGSPLLHGGYQKYVSRDLARQNVADAEASGARVLVASCTQCLSAFREDYPRLYGRSAYDVFHITQYLEKLAADKKLQFKKPVKMKIVYQDPCFLSRHGGEYDSPRKLLKRIPQLEIVEPWKTKETAECCGAGGGFPFADPDGAKDVGRRRLNQLREAGAQAIVTGCPFCLSNFEAAGLGAVKAYDVTDLLVQAL